MKSYFEKYKKTVHGIIFVGGLFALLIILSLVIKPKSGEVYDINTVQMKCEATAKERAESIDVAFAGNSESYRAFSPLQLYAQKGVTSYNLGASALRVCDCREILGNFFKQQSPKVIVLETDTLFEEGSPYRDPDAHLTNKVEKKLPLFHYHTFYKRWIPESVKEKDMYWKDASVFKGFLAETAVRPYEGGDYMSVEAPKTKIRETNRNVLKDIIKLCEKNSASLVLVSAPSATNWNSAKHAAVVKWLDENAPQVAYLDINEKLDEIGIDWANDTMDGGNHMNLYGSKKVMDYIGDYLTENYALADHRNDSNYKDWEDNVRKAGLY
ncbi:hypothetical protein SAMN05216390_10419 [Lachnospiraceae bacterium KH1T2]|nr:hypothetical protein SAMN05216390_10419 [Lachnospiraceae bacterium KH1T2]